MDGLHLALLGPPRAFHAGGPVHCASKKALGLFVYVALAGGRQSRRELARLLWGGNDEAAARTSLRTALQRLPAPLAEHLAVERESLSLLDASRVELDTRRFERLAAAADLESLQQAAALVGGELLAGLDIDATPAFDDWLHRERTRFRQLAQSVFDRLIVGHRERSRTDSAHAAAARESAMAAARRWLELEPAAEAAHRWLMQLYLDAGQRDTARAQYEVCQRELAVAHGRRPGAEVQALADAIAQGDGATPPGAVPRAPPEPPAMAGTTFVGRAEELAELERLLGDPACRLLTLHALGGSGKSRLAFVLAQQIAARFAQGTAWVALDEVATAAGLPQAMATALGLTLPAQRPPAEALAAALRGQQRLIVLDNFEHLMNDGEAADLVLALLRAAPRLVLLVTSREVLGVQEEWVFELGGLDLPGDGAAAGPGAAAADLFIARARQAYLGFSAAAEWPHVVRICRLTEGLPLALELAAAWVRTMPCGDLVRAIETEMTALATSHRNRPARQHSLDAVVRTSWSLLAHDQQATLAALGCFVGGFTQQAAQAVAGASLHGLSALVDKSLVHRRGDGRLGLHELVRRFALAQLGQRRESARLARRRHGAWFAGLLARCAAQLDGPQAVEAGAELGADLANILHAAPHWAEDGVGPEAVSAPLVRVLLTRGRVREALAVADAALDGTLPPAARAELLDLRGRARVFVGEVAAAQGDFDDAIALARARGLARTHASSALNSVLVAFVADRLPDAARRIDEAVSRVAEADDPLLAARLERLRGQLAHAEGRPTDAVAHLQRALARAEQAGAVALAASLQTSLGGPLIQLGRFDEAEAVLRAADRSLALLGSVERVSVLNTLAVLLLWRSGTGSAAEAGELARRAVDEAERAGHDTATSAALDSLGLALAALGRTDEARRCHERAATLGGPITEAEARHHLAQLDLAEGRLDAVRRRALEQAEVAERLDLPSARRSAWLLGAALAARESVTVGLARHWLGTLLADDALPFDDRRAAQALWASLPPGGPDEDSGTAPVWSDLLDLLARTGP